MLSFKNIKIAFIALTVALLSLSNLSAKEVKSEIKTPSVQCEMCKTTIETALNKLEGLISADVDFEKKVTTVKFDNEKISLDDIRNEISDAGYDADKVTKDKRAYKRLHNCCKLPEDQK